MKKIRRILFPTDFSDCAKQALGHAISLANHFGADLTMTHIITMFDDDPYNPDRQFPDISEYYDFLESRASDHFEEELNAKSLKDLNVDYIVKRGFSPAEEILDLIREREIDLVAVGTHGRKPLAHFFLGSVAEKIVERAPCPVLISRIMPTTYELVSSYKRILVPTDFSEHSKKALELALAIIPSKEGQLDVLHVVDDNIFPAYFVNGQSSIFNLMPDLRKRSREALENFAPRDSSVKTVLELRAGRIVGEIVNYAESNHVDLIVMGTRGLSEIEQLLLGSVAERVIRKVFCPVVTVK